MDLRELGWGSFFERPFAEHRARGLLPARVAVQHRGAYVLYSELGELWAEVSGRLRHESFSRAELPAVGDWVVARLRPEGSAATIEDVLPRRTRFSRHEAGLITDEQVLGVNIDVVFIVAALDRDLNARRLERYLTMAWSGGAEPVVVLTKADLCFDIPDRVRDVQSLAPAQPVHVTSGVTGAGIDALAAYFKPGRTVALLGSSGIGKSTLINVLVGHEVQHVDRTRTDGKGRHTTTARELIFVPGGGLVLDTPGMRELQLWDDDGQVSQSFDDITSLATECRFRDCRHESEPGCAVRDAVSAGDLPAERLESYKKLQRELRHLHLKQDRRAAAVERKKWRAIERSRRRSPVEWS